MSNISHRYVFSSGGALVTGTNWNDSHNVSGISTSGAVHLAGDVTLTSSLSSANGNIRATYNDTTQDLYLSSYGGASSGNAGPNLIVRGSGADAVPSIQFQFGSGSGYLNGLTLYNDSFNSTIACWQSGHRMQFYTWSPYNANTDQERLRLSSGVSGQSDYADAEFVNTGWFRIYKGTATEEKFAVNGQTGEIYPHNNIVLQSAGANIDIGDATKYLQHVWMQYLSANEVRPTTGTAVSFEDIAGNARIAIADLESGSSDWAIQPSATNTGNVGALGNRWKGGFFGNLNIASGSTITAPGNQSITPTGANLLATVVSSLSTSGSILVGGTSSSLAGGTLQGTWATSSLVLGAFQISGALDASTYNINFADSGGLFLHQTTWAGEYMGITDDVSHNMLIIGNSGQSPSIDRWWIFRDVNHAGDFDAFKIQYGTGNLVLASGATVTNFKLGGTMDANAQQIDGMGELRSTNGQVTYSVFYNGAGGGHLFRTTNAAGDAYLTRMTIGTYATTADIDITNANLNVAGDIIIANGGTPQSIKQETESQQLSIYGGMSDSGARIVLGGSTWAGGVGTIKLNTPKADTTGSERLVITGGADSVTATWAGTMQVIAPVTTGTLIDFQLETEWTTGTIINADFAGATTLTGDVTGVSINFLNNVTPLAGASTITSFKSRLPALTQSGAVTSTMHGIYIDADALVQNTAVGTINWNGYSLYMPAITQTTGSITAKGIYIQGGSITTGGTQIGIDITMASATHDAVKITTGNLNMNSNTINAAIIGTTPAAVSTGAVVVSGTNLLFYDGSSWKVVSTS